MYDSCALSRLELDAMPNQTHNILWGVLVSQVHQVDRVSSLTKQEFLDKYAFTSRPVVVTNATDGTFSLLPLSMRCYFSSAFPSLEISSSTFTLKRFLPFIFNQSITKCADV